MSLPDNYAGDGTIYGGMDDPGISVTPLWAADAPLNAWMEILNTSGAGGGQIDDYCGLPYRPDTCELFSVASGGHGKIDNRVVSIGLLADTPAWVLRLAPSTVTPDDVARNPDGKRASSHNYQTGMWDASRHRIVMHGLYGTNPTAHAFRVVDAFNPDASGVLGEWDPAGTLANMPSGTGWVGQCADANGDEWIVADSGGMYRWNHATDTYTLFSGSIQLRAPAVHDPSRGHIFHLQFGNGEAEDYRGLFAAKTSVTTGVQTAITFNASAALTELTNLKPAYSAMTYDSLKDKYYYYPGACAGVGGAGADPNTKRIFIITANAGTVWDIASFTPSGGVTPMPSISGIHSRFRYIPELKGIICLPQKASNLVFMRTA